MELALREWKRILLVNVAQFVLSAYALGLYENNYGSIREVESTSTSSWVMITCMCVGPSFVAHRLNNVPCMCVQLIHIVMMVMVVMNRYTQDCGVRMASAMGSGWFGGIPVYSRVHDHTAHAQIW